MEETKIGEINDLLKDDIKGLSDGELKSKFLEEYRNLVNKYGVDFQPSMAIVKINK